MMDDIVHTPSIPVYSELRSKSLDPDRSRQKIVQILPTSLEVNRILFYFIVDLIGPRELWRTVNHVATIEEHITASSEV